MNVGNDKQQKNTLISRRMFVKMGLWVSGLASGWGIFQFLSYKPPVKEPLLPSITLDHHYTFPIGTLKYVPEVKAWLMRDAEGLYAVSAICTHLGCTVNGQEDHLSCPCHGSQFMLSGRVLEGPATIALPNFSVNLTDEGNVVIDREVTVPPTQRLKP